LILPLDGYVFWVNSNLLSDSALYNASQYNAVEFANSDGVIPPKVILVKGSLHFATELLQNDAEIAARNEVVFTTQEEIQNFNLINPNFIYIAEFEEIRFAFSSHHNFYRQALLYHYHGKAIYSVMESQIIDNMKDFDSTDVIVSNSLPLWLSLNKYFPVFPAFLSQQNSVLPYATVYIDPKNTFALQSEPRLYLDSSHYQLTKDVVKIQMFGVRNAAALEFQDYVFEYSRNTDNFGLMNVPIMQDEHVTQRELGIIAQKKTITFEISYYQENILTIAKQLILSAFITITPSHS
jgi:hypothetical protein